MESIRTTVFLLLTSCITGHATVFDQDVEQKVKSYIDVSMKCRNIPGMTLSVVKGKYMDQLMRLCSLSHIHYM